MIKLSIITINYNNASGLQKTIESVVNQTHNEFEYIIIDGGSNDDSVNIIKQYANKIKYWVSEKDKGVYDAMNKGILKANGDYLLFLNSGDSFYVEDVTSKFLNFVNKDSYDIVYGKSTIISKNKPNSILTPPISLNLKFWYRNTLNHQAVFIKRQLFSDYELYNINYKICSDFDFFLKVFINKGKASYKFIDEIICNYENTGISSKEKNFKYFFAEKNKILNTYLSKNELKKLKEEYLITLPSFMRLAFLIYHSPVLFPLLSRFYYYSDYCIKKLRY